MFNIDFGFDGFFTIDKDAHDAVIIIPAFLGIYGFIAAIVGVGAAFDTHPVLGAGVLSGLFTIFLILPRKKEKKRHKTFRLWSLVFFAGLTIVLLVEGTPLAQEVLRQREVAAAQQAEIDRATEEENKRIGWWGRAKRAAFGTGEDE